MAVMPFDPTWEGWPWSGTIFGAVAYWDPSMTPYWNLTNTALVLGILTGKPKSRLKRF